MDSLVSIIIPTYNRAELLIETIQSVLSQTYESLEVIVVDDGSTDDTREKVAPLLNSNRVFYYYQINQGRSTARNNGIEQARGEWLMFLDSDDLLTQNALQLLIEKSLQNSSAGMIAGGIGFIDEKGHQYEPDFEYGSNDKGILGDCYGSLIKRESCFLLGSYIVKKSVVETGGYFDKNMEPSEDSDFAWRVSLNTEVFRTTEVIMFYRSHGGNTNHAQIRKAEIEVAQKHLKQYVPSLPNASLYTSHLMFFKGISYHQIQAHSQALRNYLLSIWYAPTIKLLDWRVYRLIVGCLLPEQFKAYKKAFVRDKAN